MTGILVLLGFCLSGLFIFLLLRSRHRKAETSDLNMLGMTAHVKTTLTPEGAIILGGELWRARVMYPSAPLRPGHPVRVLGANGHFLLVEPKD